MDKIIIASIRLHCDNKEAFALFTQKGHLKKWLTEDAEIDLREGGRYELFWNPDNPEEDSTIGCKILAVKTPYFLNFEWKGPKEFKHFMNNTRPLTNVSIFIKGENNHSQVILVHTGWRDSEEWEKARTYFKRTWQGALEYLVKYVDKNNSKS